jgi:hypothetical protein
LLPLVPIPDLSVAICFLSFSLHVQTTVKVRFDYIDNNNDDDDDDDNDDDDNNNNNNNTKLWNKFQAHDESGFVSTARPIGIVLSN